MRSRSCRVLLSTVVVLSAVATVTAQGQGRRTRPSTSVPAASPVPVYDPTEKTIAELQRALDSRQVTSRQLVDAYLARIAEYDQRGPALNAVKAVNPDARAQADALDAERASRGPRGPLHGIPVLVKDNYETVEMPTTAGSLALAAFHPRRDAFQVQRLKAAGAIVIGKTNMHELASGITSIGSSFGQVRNPSRSRPKSRRVEWWDRRGRGGELRRGRDGQRHLRVDSESRVAQQSRRAARHARAL